jgi:hypothetical protein
MEMDNIILITGKVKFTITLDPSVWIFDDRKVDLHTYFTHPSSNEQSEQEDEVRKLSQYWEREIQEGSVFPPTLKTEKQFEKERILTGTFGMPLEPFLRNAEPLAEANSLKIVTANDEISLPLSEAYHLILGFSKDGKPLKEDGPVHIYYGDGSNRERPITHVKKFIVD